MSAQEQLRQAVQALRDGGIVAYPTEGVWGVGCDPRNERAVSRLVVLKQRDWRKGLILLAADFDMLRPFVRVPSERALDEAQKTWPGPVTWIFPAGPDTIKQVRGEHAGIAVRVTAHPLAARLSRVFGAPVVSTSANLSGQPAALTATDVRAQLGDGVDVVLDGPLGGLQGPTAIRDIETGEYLRRPAGEPAPAEH